MLPNSHPSLKLCSWSPLSHAPGSALSCAPGFPPALSYAPRSPPGKTRAGFVPAKGQALGTPVPSGAQENEPRHAAGNEAVRDQPEGGFCQAVESMTRLKSGSPPHHQAWESLSGCLRGLGLNPAAFTVLTNRFHRSMSCMVLWETAELQDLHRGQGEKGPWYRRGTVALDCSRARQGRIWEKGVGQCWHGE